MKVEKSKRGRTPLVGAPASSTQGGNWTETDECRIQKRRPHMARANHSWRKAHLPLEHIQATALSVSSKASHAVFPTSCVDRRQRLAESCRPWAYVPVLSLLVDMLWVPNGLTEPQLQHTHLHLEGSSGRRERNSKSKDHNKKGFPMSSVHSS